MLTQLSPFADYVFYIQVSFNTLISFFILAFQVLFLNISICSLVFPSGLQLLYMLPVSRTDKRGGHLSILATYLRVKICVSNYQRRTAFSTLLLPLNCHSKNRLYSNVTVWFYKHNVEILAGSVKSLNLILLFFYSCNKVSLAFFEFNPCSKLMSAILCECFALDDAFRFSRILKQN